jgi:hypothetical protein
MADNHDLLTCPLCEGHGEIRRAHLLELLEQQKIQPRIEACLETDDAAKPELVEAAVGTPARRSFQEDVHSWNPQLPMWRRSPKE